MCALDKALGTRTLEALSLNPRILEPWNVPKDERGAQVDTLRPGLLGPRDEFAFRYCGRRLCARTGRGGAQVKVYDNSGVSRPQELHGLLNRVRGGASRV